MKYKSILITVLWIVWLMLLILLRLRTLRDTKWKDNKGLYIESGIYIFIFAASMIFSMIALIMQIRTL